MKFRILITIVIVVAAGADVAARSPFGRFRTGRKSISRHTRSHPTAQLPPHVLNDPTEMTKRFGKSILIRNESAGPDDRKFANQPEPLKSE